jgi:hypothetical protein
MKKIAILQSNYIPWKGYFDLIAAVDEFIFYDDVQFTKNDWRNRNKIKTPQGVAWLTIPVGEHIHREIRDVCPSNNLWQEKHWKSLCSNYSRTAYFREVGSWLEPLYLGKTHLNLSALNREFIVSICNYLGIQTHFGNSWDFETAEGRVERLVSICRQAGASHYVTGPAARSYLSESDFSKAHIKVNWFDYSGYPAYPQCWGTFEPAVTILDLLFNCGPNAGRYMKYAPGSS